MININTFFFVKKLAKSNYWKLNTFDYFCLTIFNYLIFSSYVY